MTTKQTDNADTDVTAADNSATNDVASTSTQSEWGKEAEDFYGYSSEEERLAKRGLEDWEMVDKIPESQADIPKWFVAVIIAVLLFAIGLSFPFWGDRAGFEREWFNWGFVLALVYIAISSGFIYVMLSLYGSKAGGRLDSDKHDSDKNIEEKDKENSAPDKSDEAETK